MKALRGARGAPSRRARIGHLFTEPLDRIANAQPLCRETIAQQQGQHESIDPGVLHARALGQPEEVQHREDRSRIHHKVQALPIALERRTHASVEVTASGTSSTNAPNPARINGLVVQVLRSIRPRLNPASRERYRATMRECVEETRQAQGRRRRIIQFQSARGGRRRTLPWPGGKDQRMPQGSRRQHHEQQDQRQRPGVRNGRRLADWNWMIRLRRPWAWRVSSTHSRTWPCTFPSTRDSTRPN